MLRYVIAVEGVENDQVILEGVGQGSFGKYSTVLIENLNLIVLCEVEVFFCDLGNSGVYLDRVNHCSWKQSVKGHR